MGYRSGRWKRLDDDDRGMLNSAIAYAKHGWRIVSRTVITRLRIVMKRLRVVNRIRVLLDGEIKAKEMRTQFRERGVFCWIPKLKAWLRDPVYIFWLGTLQITLEELYPTTTIGPG